MLENMNEFRCEKCKKLLFKYKLSGHMKIDVKCTRCRYLTRKRLNCNE
ncbi:hypothetical protein [Crassaminicella thermophila]|nr:hypothetical protein [Crassaminicella thermophila]